MKGLIEQVKTRTKIFLRCAIKIGQDPYGNTYYESRNVFTGTPKNCKRWVLYKGIAEGSKVPGLWHAWLHFYGEIPLQEASEGPFHLPNMTGAFKKKTFKYLSSSVTSQYIPWKPE